MARYTAKKRENELGEFASAAIMALHILSVQCEICLNVKPGGVGEIYVPGRAIANVMGGKWNWYRHLELMKLAEPGGWIKAYKGYEKGSERAEVWRYALSEAGRTYLMGLAAQRQKDCVYLVPEQEPLFHEN